MRPAALLALALAARSSTRVLLAEDLWRYVVVRVRGGQHWQLDKVPRGVRADCPKALDEPRNS